MDYTKEEAVSAFKNAIRRAEVNHKGNFKLIGNIIARYNRLFPEINFANVYSVMKVL